MIIANKKPVFVSIPCLDYSPIIALEKQLSYIVSKFYPQLEPKVVLINMLSVGTFFKYKNMAPSSLLNNFVYNLRCGQCGSTYIGEAIHYFTTRIAQHSKVCVRTGVRRASPGESRIR